MGKFDSLLKWLGDPANRGLLPSYLTSSLSQVFVLAAASYLIVAAKVAWTTGDMTHIKWGAEAFGIAYLARQLTSGKNGGPPPAGGATA